MCRGGTPGMPHRRRRRSVAFVQIILEAWAGTTLLEACPPQSLGGPNESHAARQISSRSAWSVATQGLEASAGQPMAWFFYSRLIHRLLDLSCGLGLAPERAKDVEASIPGDPSG